MTKTDGTADQVTALLLSAAQARQIVPNADPWGYGWSVESYRRSANPTAPSPHGPIAYSEAGVAAIEEGVNALLKDTRIRNIWAEADLWELAVSAISTIPLTVNDEQLRAIVASRVARILKPGATVVAFAVANSIWQGPPLRIGEAVLGQIGPEWFAAVGTLAGNDHFLQDDAAKRWYSEIEAAACGSPTESGEQGSSHKHGPGESCGATFPMDVNIPPATVFATKSRFQLSRSRRHASERFNDIVDLALLFEICGPGDLRTSRPTFNRPGRRGITLDRVAIEHAIARTAHVPELASNTLVCASFATTSTRSWHQAEPLDLSALLSESDTLEKIERILAQNTPLSRRLRVASRWYAQAHWSEQNIDAVLALGIALDALVGDKSGLPTSALAERYGLLEPVPAKRSSRSSDFREMYQVRSAVAHGSLTPTKVDAAFRAKMVASVRWASQRLIALDESFTLSTDDDVRMAFENLRWGTAQWTEISNS